MIFFFHVSARNRPSDVGWPMVTGTMTGLPGSILGKIRINRKLRTSAGSTGALAAPRIPGFPDSRIPASRRAQPTAGAAPYTGPDEVRAGSCR